MTKYSVRLRRTTGFDTLQRRKALWQFGHVLRHDDYLEQVSGRASIAWNHDIASL
jgi:hypothetical protein